MRPPRTQACRVCGCLHGGNGRHAPFGALLPLFIIGSESIFRVVVVRKTRVRSRRENDLVYPPPRAARGRGTMRSMVEGARCAQASREAVAPSTVLLRRPVPLPRFAGQDEGTAAPLAPKRPEG